MSALPETQRRDLEAQLRIHQQRLETLRDQQEHIVREMRIHELVLDLGRDERLLEALAEIADNPELAKRAAADPLAYAREKGISVSGDVDVSVDVTSEGVSVSAIHGDDVRPFVVSWDANEGFAARPLTTEDSAGT
jgi:hypothetical protein